MSQHHTDDHDRGLAFDLGTLLKRRQVLSLLGVAGTLEACGGPPSHSEPNKTATAADGTICIKDPAETNGPFPGDGTNSKNGSTVNVLTQSGIIREDIRGSFGAMTPTATGTNMSLAVQLIDVSNACKPLANHVIYVWHCDVDGRYSLYDDTDRNYLRGVGISDANGMVKFMTVFPGCYDGRWPHIHFEVFASQEKAVSGKDSLLISQFALPADVCKSVYDATAAYAASVKNLTATTLDADMVFADNTAEQKAAMTLKVTGDVAKGLAATGVVGVVVS